MRHTCSEMSQAAPQGPPEKVLTATEPGPGIMQLRVAFFVAAISLSVKQTSSSALLNSSRIVSSTFSGCRGQREGRHLELLTVK